MSKQKEAAASKSNPAKVRQRETTPQIEDLVDSDCPAPNGILLVIGGAEDKGGSSKKHEKRKEEMTDFVDLEIIGTFIKLIDKEEPRIEIITSAGSEPEESEKEYMEVFRKKGCANLGFIHDFTRLTTVDSPYLERLRAADAVYFSGGDQLKLTALYGGTEFLAILKQRYVYDRLVIAGTSAGAMAMSTPMIYEGDEEIDMLKGKVKVTTGLEFIKDVAIDTHFVKRGRFVRMATVLASNPGCIGIGVEEDTAAIIRNGRDLQVIGSGAVIIIDAHKSRHTNFADVESHSAVSMQDMIVHMLVKNDRYTIPSFNLLHK
jgi:cyanophycinase